MEEQTYPSDQPDATGRERREFDLAVLGATGVTGRLVVRRLHDLFGASTGLRWAAAGRDGSRVREVLAGVGIRDARVVVADLDDVTSVRALAARTQVLLNLAGPYTPTAEMVVRSCIDARTSYVDLSGELPLLRRVIDGYDQPARAAGVQIVQMAGWEALPADVTTLLACFDALGSDRTSSEPEGTGAGRGIRSVQVEVRFTRTPEGRRSIEQSVSAGTVGSIVSQLRDDEARVIGDPAGLLPKGGQTSSVRSRSPFQLRPRVVEGRLLGPVVPVAFLDAPIIHRTAALLAAEQGIVHEPARYREGSDRGPYRGWRSAPAVVTAGVSAGLQRTLVLVAHAPPFLRGWVAAVVNRVSPSAGGGPSGHHLTDWAWTVRAKATTVTGRSGTAVLEGTGHPGYTATANMIAAVGIHLATSPEAGRRAGCLTPALSLGLAGAGGLRSPELRVVPDRVGRARTR